MYPFYQILAFGFWRRASWNFGWVPHGAIPRRLKTAAFLPSWGFGYLPDLDGRLDAGSCGAPSRTEAPFKRNDEPLKKIKPKGVVIFGKAPINLNLGQQAQKLKIPMME